jgi:hypothetical protein
VIGILMDNAVRDNAITSLSASAYLAASRHDGAQP